MYASHWEANTTQFKPYSNKFMIKPASKPPRNRRVRLIFPIGILHERSPECRNSKGAEGTVGWSLRGGHGASQGEKRAGRDKIAALVRQDDDIKSPLLKFFVGCFCAGCFGFGLPSRRARASSSILAMRRSRVSGVRQ